MVSTPRISSSSTPLPERGHWGELLNWPDEIAAIAKALDGSVDEHGAWTTGIETDSRQRGSAVNVDLYDYGVDLTRVPRRRTPQPIAVVQVRLWRRTRARQQWPEVLKDYYLIGRNERGTPFAHAIPANLRRGAKDAPLGAICARAQAWVFGVQPHQLDQLHRQGDVALQRIDRLPRGLLPVSLISPIPVLDSHRIQRAGVVYVDDAGVPVALRDGVLRHGKRQHLQVGGDGLWRIRTGRRGTSRSFTREVGD